LSWKKYFGQPMMPRVSLNLVVIFSNDLQRSVEFYTSLGLTFTLERHGNGPEHFASEIGGLVFEIYPRPADGENSGPARIGFRVASVDEALATLKLRGVRVLSAPHDSPWGRRAVVSDPDGRRVEISE
jgi:catechol 2,3-dioxygenase-like lactoylglutathione lyase family enzyme